MFQITSSSAPDPIAQMLLVDSYMLWALEAAQAVIGEDELKIVLREAGLVRFINNFPPDELTISGNIRFSDYADLSAGLLNFFKRPGKSMVMRIGRESAKLGIQHQSNVFNLATMIAAKLLPAPTQVKMGLAAMLAGFRVISEKAGQDFKGTIEEHGDHYHFILETCPVCAGKQSDSHICWLMEGTIEESNRQVFGKFFDVVEIECRAKGDPACVFRVPKQPSEEGMNVSAML